MLIEYREIIDKELRLFSDKLPLLSIYDPIKYIISNGGKRFRSSLTLMAADLFSNQPLLAINEAIAIELFHNFTLIHDDIMDQAPIGETCLLYIKSGMKISQFSLETCCMQL